MVTTSPTASPFSLVTTFNLFAAFGTSHEDKASYAFYLFNGFGMIINFSVNNLNAPNRPHPSPPQSGAVQNCGTIKVNWRFYIPLCSTPPPLPLPSPTELDIIPSYCVLWFYSWTPFINTVCYCSYTSISQLLLHQHFHKWI
jgi:hypothetical protein